MRKALFKPTILIIILLFSFQLNAQIEKLAKTATETFFHFSEIKAVPTNYVVIDSDKEHKSVAFNFENGGWIILKDDTTHEIIAFSDKGKFTGINNPLMKGRLLQNGLINSKTQNTIKNMSFNGLTSINKNTNNVDAFLPDVWGGINCWDAGGSNVYPSNYYTPIHCSPGCVAISSAQVLHYYEWPLTGVGNNTYKDNYTDRNGDTTLRRHTQHFDNHNYDWANMLDEYQGINTTTVQQEAVGLLMYDMGVAVQMNYEDLGSTSNLINIPEVLSNYFRFSGTYHSQSWSGFWTKVRESIEAHRPIPIAIENSDNDEGHVFVADGIVISGSTELHHLNWGWYNRDNTNGWYNIRAWVVGGTGYDTVLGAIFDMLPEPQITDITPTGSGNDFTVNWVVSDLLNATEYTLEQKVDQESDWTEIATGITQTNYTITNPTGDVYLFRVKAKSEGRYYDNSWSEREVYAVSGSYNGYANFGGGQHCFARQTTDIDIDFTGDYTMETWLRVLDGNQDGDVILDQKNVFGLTIENVTASDYSVRFTSFSSGVSITTSGTKPLNNQWVHVAVSKTGSNIKLFINGIQQAAASSSFNLIASNEALNIGEKYHGSYSSLITADFDQLRLSSIGRYTTNFTPNQATDFTVDSDTKAYYKFQNIHRNRLKDEAHKISVVAVNSSNYVVWKLDTNSTASVSQQELNNMLNVYPNPTSNYITINYTENGIFNLEDLTFSVFDITGKQVIKTSINSVNNKIDLTNLTNGTYFLKVSGNDFSATQKIIKQ
jgi:hypothetical protein